MIMRRKAFENIARKEKMLVNSTFSFSHNVFYSSQLKFQFLGYIYFNLEGSKILSFGKELK